MTRVRLVVRYDDFSNGSPDDLDGFLVETAVASGVPLSVAAIPLGWGPSESRGVDAEAGGETEALRADKAAILAPGLNSGTIALAQHGFDHTAVGRDPLGRPAEFSGQSVTEQVHRAGRGRAHLESVFGAPPTTFVPPWNRFDPATVAALGQLGFDVLSAGREIPSDAYSESELALIPATTVAAELRSQVLAARQTADLRLMVALLHPYDFCELGTPWSHLERDGWSDLVHWLGDQEDVETTTLDRLAETEADLGVARLGGYAAYHASPTRRLIPGAWPGSLDRPLSWYPGRSAMRSLVRKRWLTVLAVWLPLAMVGVGAGSALGAVVSRSTVLQWSVRAAAIGLSGALVIRALRSDGPYFKGLAITLLVIAAAIGVWLG